MEGFSIRALAAGASIHALTPASEPDFLIRGSSAEPGKASVIGSIVPFLASQGSV
jgi:hypothetical protein